MLKTLYRHAINLRCDSLLKLFLLIVIGCASRCDAADTIQYESRLPHQRLHAQAFNSRHRGAIGWRASGDKRNKPPAKW